MGEAFHRFLVVTLGPGGLLRLFADDTAVVLEDIWTLGPILAALFGQYESFSGLHLKLVKCVVVNLGRGRDEALKERMAEEIPAWADFPVSGRGKYLGTWLGLSASEFWWVGSVGKFKERVEAIPSLGYGHFPSGLLYKVYAVSVLS